ncbi:vWA domain-containing protein [Thermochromatium tepidum]|uniref:VWA domain-containing protein n=1 Tax=Thermochromatium tepidum ATCC 43061 TaxID=316276 RepID=A0A6I6EAE5_THETI|nr:vWA domain-containing protein [Thermochromatium tepidum]QGU31899.1 VWA domain-containing protein [Thermochromatium tepidum ATCC 43061]
MAPLNQRRFLAALALLWSIAVQIALAAPPDVRLVIDVSGSMRQTDPRNLRVPALQIVNELIPPGSICGVWLFAEQTEVLVAPAQVDAAWKKQLAGRLTRIHSRGLFTDIEGAIRTATQDWSKAPPEGERHLILLTDGLVDVSKDPADSAASRERILTEQIESLRSMGVKVHPIGLSDQIDEPLMRLLATQTGGWMEIVQEAALLQRVFLRVLEQSAPPTTVPIQGNRFQIDDQVREFTLLAFRPEGGQSQLTTPDGERIRADRPAPGVVWRSEAGYDLVTISNPKPGQWRIRGVEDPDNRVVILTDLGIEVAPVPNAVGLGESPKLESWLTDHNQQVTRPEVVGVLSAKVIVTSAPETPLPQPASGAIPATEAGLAPPTPGDQTLATDERIMVLDAANARFSTLLETQRLTPGFYRLDFVIDGGSFQRQLSRHLKIKGAPLGINYERKQPSEADPQAAMLLQLRAEPDLVDPSSLSGYLLARGPEGWTEVVEITKGKRFPLTVKIPIQQPGEYQVTSHFMGLGLTGEPIEVKPEPGVLNFDFAPPPQPTAPGPEGSISWGWLFIYVLGGNVWIGALLALTWWLMTRARSPRDRTGAGASKTKGAGRTRA